MSNATFEPDQITVTELPDASDATLIGNVLGVYQQHGYEAGYRRGAQDVLLSLLGTTEDVIRGRQLGAVDAANLRRAVWALHESLESRSDVSAASAAGFVEGGLGI